MFVQFFLAFAPVQKQRIAAMQAGWLRLPSELMQKLYTGSDLQSLRSPASPRAVTIRTEKYLINVPRFPPCFFLLLY